MPAGLVGRTIHRRRGTPAAHDTGRAVAGKHEVVAGPADEDVDTIAAQQDVVACGPGEQVVVDAAVKPVAALSAPQGGFALAVEDGGVDFDAGIQAVVATSAAQDVAAVTTQDQVRIGAAVGVVFSRTAFELVFASVAPQVVVAGQPQQAVGAIAAVERVVAVGAAGAANQVAQGIGLVVGEVLRFDADDLAVLVVAVGGAGDADVAPIVRMGRTPGEDGAVVGEVAVAFDVGALGSLCGGGLEGEAQFAGFPVLENDLGVVWAKDDQVAPGAVGTDVAGGDAGAVGEAIEAAIAGILLEGAGQLRAPQDDAALAVTAVGDGVENGVEPTVLVDAVGVEAGAALYQVVAAAAFEVVVAGVAG